MLSNGGFTDFVDVTEIADRPISREQLERLVSRYRWAVEFCRERDVAEIGCGTGPGLGLLASVARTFEAGDVSPKLLAIARRHYGGRIRLRELDAHHLPYADASKDVIILFEAIYYLRSPERFMSECARVLRSGGSMLLASANKDLWDFHASPFSHRYLGVDELTELCAQHGFECEFFGFQSIDRMPLRQRMLRPVKRAAVVAGLMPRTMAGKRWLKRLVFGAETTMPAELSFETAPYVAPERIPAGRADRSHKIVYCHAWRRSRNS